MSTWNIITASCRRRRRRKKLNTVVADSSANWFTSVINTKLPNLCCGIGPPPRSCCFNFVFDIGNYFLIPVRKSLFLLDVGRKRACRRCVRVRVRVVAYVFECNRSRPSNVGGSGENFESDTTGSQSKIDSREENVFSRRIAGFNTSIGVRNDGGGGGSGSVLYGRNVLTRHVHDSRCNGIFYIYDFEYFYARLLPFSIPHTLSTIFFLI